MNTQILQNTNIVNVPVSLEQLAVGIRKLSHSELLTLELLVDKKAMKTIAESLVAEKNGRVKPFRTE